MRLILALLFFISLPVFAQTSVSVDLDKANFGWTWTQGTGGTVDYFKVKCGTSSGNYSLNNIIQDPAARALPVKNIITSIGDYFCVVVAGNQFGESADSNEVSFSAGLRPNAPTSLQITAQ